ncbi:uncharacterized protein LOC124162387 [Ischnura elegans]|uniref:uncharacterized protein LOC124162387 n=1 Tax=Ischnura elegans TaxID=197161 RepID=UPI001ED86FB7|nr:uncharacterized protein LOC124162387 [Ischnura elegans]
MKGFLAVLLVAVLHYANAEGQCQCAAFLRSSEDPSQPDLTSRMYLQEDEHVDSCEGDDMHKACSDMCVQSIGRMTDGGNLDYVRPDGKTVGELACSLLDKDVNMGEVAAFSKLCDGNWEFGKASTPQYICCNDGHYSSCT